MATLVFGLLAIPAGPPIGLAAVVIALALLGRAAYDVYRAVRTDRSRTTLRLIPGGRSSP
jgi:hypothetical protein